MISLLAEIYSISGVGNLPFVGQIAKENQSIIVNIHKTFNIQRV